MCDCLKILKNDSFCSFRGMQGTFVPAIKTDAFVLMFNYGLGRINA